MDNINIERIDELEIKVAFQDELLEKLNQIIIKQQQQIDLLQSQLYILYRIQSDKSETSKNAPYSLFEELPPHY